MSGAGDEHHWSVLDHILEHLCRTNLLPTQLNVLVSSAQNRAVYGSDGTRGVVKKHEVLTKSLL